MKTPEQLVEVLETVLTAEPPVGVDVAYVKGFFDRQRPALIVMLAELLAERAAREPPEPEPGVVTPEGGRAGIELTSEGLREGQRVVVNLAYDGNPPELRHGRVEKITRMTSRSILIQPGMNRLSDAKEEHWSSVDVTLDSGRTRAIYRQNRVYEEIAPPAPDRVVPDIQVAVGGSLIPSWWEPNSYYDSNVVGDWKRIREALEAAERARLPTRQAALRQTAAGALQQARRALGVYQAWLASLPEGVNVSRPHEKDPVRHRRIELDLALHRSADEDFEWKRVSRADEMKSWRELAVGERVLAWFGRVQDQGWWIALKEGGHVTLSRAPVDPAAPEAVDAITVPIWMVDMDVMASRVPSAASYTPSTETEGCQEVIFTLPSHGRIHVVCGARGRRDVWHNVYVGNTRYGFNGGRWAKGMRPPEDVLVAVRQRGITIFGG